jgi:hypothetical protein
VKGTDPGLGRNAHSWTRATTMLYVEHPWGQLLSQHRLHLVSLQSEVEDVSNSNQELARRGLMRSREIIASLGEQSVDVYDPRGYAAPLKASALRLDRTV